MGESQATLSLVIKAKNMASGELGKINQGLTNIGLGGFAGVAGIAALTGALAGAVKGAIEEEQSLARLAAVLDANVPSWTAHQGAIDDATKAAQNLGYKDDDVRESLIKLLPATKDVNKAIDLQRTAMDLARLKAIPLADASAALVKVWTGGGTREMKTLGIVIADNATVTEKLAAIQAVAGGQAAAYAGTLAGKSEILNAKLAEVSDTIGEKLIPVLTNLATVALAVMDLFDSDSPETFLGHVMDIANAISDFNPGIYGTREIMEKLDRSTANAALSMDTFAEKGAAAREPIMKLRGPVDNLAGSFGGLWSNASNALDSILNYGKVPIDVINKLFQVNRAISGPASTPGAGSTSRQAPTNTGGVTIRGVSEKDIGDVIDRQLYVTLRRAGTAS